MARINGLYLFRVIRHEMARINGLYLFRVIRHAQKRIPPPPVDEICKQDSNIETCIFVMFALTV